MDGEFFQEGPVLGNQYSDDDLLRAWLRWRMPPDVLGRIEPHLVHLGERARGDLLDMANEAEAQPPEHVPYDAWGRRVDEIRVSAGWRGLERAAAEEGVVATAYERHHGAWSRVYQGALLYLYHPSSAYFSCPLAMSDGAARLLEVHGAAPLKTEVLCHLTSRDPREFWTSGQWMTERSGGSDVSGTETVARPQPDGTYTLHGAKWFGSSATSQMAMTLARIAGDPAGSRGLSLFFVKLRDNGGRLNNIVVHRLKNKLGTRALPTAELGLRGCPATLIGEQGRGVRSIATLFNVTRLYNSVCAVASMRRAYALARDYAERRSAFGRRLIEHPLHAQTIQEMKAELQGSLFLTLHLLMLEGRVETGEASPEDALLLRILTPIAKLYTARRALAVVSEGLESLGGAGYMEELGLARLLRDTQVLSIWEGTTNVLSLDMLRAFQKEGAGAVLEADIDRRIAALHEPGVARLRQRLERRHHENRELTARMVHASEEETQRGARQLAFRLAAVYIGALLAEYSQAEPSACQPAIENFLS
jgi:putative acyl-CoA dehydrogenase